MATMEVTDNKVQDLFDKLESQRIILSTCTDLYKTLTSHFTSLQQSIDSKTLTLDSKIQSLDSNYQKSLDNLHERENSIADRLSSLTSLIESQKQAAIAELEKQIDENAPSTEFLRSLCRRMDHSWLMRFIVERRRETTTLRSEMPSALAECVDAPRLVLEVVREFVEMKAAAKSGLTDKRWACGLVVGGMFPPEKLKEKKVVGPEFSTKTVEMAEGVVRDWREKAEKIGGGEGLSGMQPAEASIFLQIVMGFGLREKFEEEFYWKLMMEFAARRDMAKLAVPIFGDKVADLIDELIKNGKEVEAVYFAFEASLTERFQPASLLKSYLRNSKKNTTDILKKGNHKAAAIDEANNFEINYIKSIIKCVEDLNLEAEFPSESLRKRLTVVEKAKADKKKASAGGTKPSNKRVFGTGGARASGPPPPRPTKMPKFSGPYPTYAQRDPVSQAMSPVSRYLAPYSYPSQTAYDPGLTASAYPPSYGGSHIPPDQITQQQYGVPGGSVASAGPRLGGAYGSQIGYASYDYGATATPSYQPPSYAQ